MIHLGHRGDLLLGLSLSMAVGVAMEEVSPYYFVCV